MSFYNDASLVVIPSGFKTSKVYAEKPTDGSGDLAFTRTGDTATRVNSAGLIEKVRTNLILQSNTFSTTWVSAGSGATRTSGQPDPDGGTSAWLLAKLGTTGRIEQTITMAANEQTFSIVAKKGTSNFLNATVYDGTNAHEVYFNLDTGAVGTQNSAVGSIVSLGNGWFRCSVTSTNANASGIIQIFISNSNGSITGTTGNIYIYQSQFENGVATAYIPTTTAAVSVGPVANVPRLDYLGSTCGKLLLEPQRTNFTFWSEIFDNAYWGKVRGAITQNSVVAPDGTTSADVFASTSGQTIAPAITRLNTTGAFVGNTAYTFSIFAKVQGNTSIFNIGYVDNSTGFTGGSALYNLATQAITITQSPNASVTASMQDYGNGWYRLVLSFLTIASPTYNYIQFGQTTTSTGNGFALWGAQLEAGSFATSYVPTLAASATRGADACSKTGISSLIGQTEGTFYHQFSVPVDEAVTRSVVLSNGTTANRVALSVFSNALFTRVDVGGVNQVNSSATIVPTATNKVAFRYKANDFAAYVNGVKVITDTSGSTFTAGTLNQIAFVQPDSTSPFNGRSNQVLLFTTALTDAELATLTTL